VSDRSPGRSLALAALILFVLAAASHSLAAIGWAVLADGALGAYYLFDVRRRPFLRCGRCGGSNRLHSKVWTYAFGHCGRCHGTGKRLRLGARVFFGQKGLR